MNARREDVMIRQYPDGSVYIGTAVLGGPSITLAPFEWRALMARVRELIP